MSDECLTPQEDWKGVYVKSEDYRKNCGGCGRGYHGNRWDAHHILPAVVFGSVTDPFIHECLRSTDFDINKAYALGGLPKLTAFILYFQKDPTMAFKKRKEKTVTMRRWGKVQQYANQAHIPVAFPGDLPVHNPCNWGHTDYIKDVADYLESNVWASLRSMKKKNKHPTPEQIKALLEQAVTDFWDDLVSIGQGPGGGGFSGVEANLRNRYDKAKNGWWKPLCMSKNVKSAPVSPSLA
ncbi:hypothetical protein JY651_43750 [Pyxidicoccus parkwayensis]|uniref:HNH endonuclease n=1 Tax=Pyxidicoccus parkwayensis TaxID=2813578 RepID=A0ABX7NSW3_9BACT|nr:hypothetical protein [Pyxidicoccus parkwaysis]QSQ21989.1 hypothetical protein JY651_43750 [Pyxidicoccus parkwaysis]